jgi:hypothetical protein
MFGFGVLALVLAAALSDRRAAADDAPAATAKPGMIVVVGDGKPVAGQPTTLAYAWDRKADKPPLFFGGQSLLVGDVHALAITRDGRHYFVCKNRFDIVHDDHKGEEAVFKHATYVRHVALDDADNLYFSEASGARENGKIYRLVPAAGGGAAKADPVCTVALADIGYWGGDFAFGRTNDGKLDTDTLYVSSGNLTPASIYRMTRKAGTWSKPERVFGAEMRIEGLVMTGPGEGYFVSRNQVYQLTDLRRLKSVLTLPDVTRLTCLTVVPAPPGDRKKPAKQADSIGD